MADQTRTQPGRNPRPRARRSGAGRFNPLENKDLLPWYWVRHRRSLGIGIVSMMGCHSEICSRQIVQVSGTGQMMCVAKIGEGFIRWELIPWKQAVSTIDLQ